MVWPKTFATTVAPSLRSSGSFSATKAFTPMFCNPIAFTNPLAVSQIRGAGEPSMGWMESPLVTTAPRRLISTSGENSIPYPNVPLAAIMGFLR
jgi:hypothetical protein